MQRAHANVELYDGFHLQPALLYKSPSPSNLCFYAPPCVPHMHLDLAHARIIHKHCLAQLQDEGVVNVHHLKTPYRPFPISLRMLLDALSNEMNFTNTSLGLVLPGLQAQAMAYMSRHRAMSDICVPGGLATAVAGRLGLHATHEHTQVLAVLLLAWLTLLD
jgi:hypothetical protein